MPATPAAACAAAAAAAGPQPAALPFGAGAHVAPARPGGIVALPAPPRFTTPAPLAPDDRQRMRELGSMRTSLSAQLRNGGGGGGGGGFGLGGVGGGGDGLVQQLRELARAQGAAAARRRKHTPLAQRRLAPEAEWWDCLLDSLGLDGVAVTV